VASSTALVVLASCGRTVSPLADGSAGPPTLPGSGGAVSAGNGDASVPPNGSTPSGAGGASGGGAQGELPSTGTFHGNSGPDGGVAGADSGPSPSRDASTTKPPVVLRNTPPGVVVQFDPDEVYAVGYVSDVNQYAGPYGIAPIENTEDSVLALPLFGETYLRPTDGHLLYTTQGSNADGATTLYEFRRDEADLTNLTAGETVVADSTVDCATVAPGPGGPNQPGGDYVIGLDGVIYYSCFVSLGVNLGTLENWYSPSNALLASSLYPDSVGAGGRALGVTSGGTITVYELAGASVFARHTVQSLFGQDAAAVMTLAARAHSSGFWVAQGPPNSAPSEDVSYVDLDLSGDVVRSGVYAPFPSGVTVTYDQWTGGWPVIDGHGALYQFALNGEDGVIVKRPMSGESTVVYAQSSWDVNHPHQVSPQFLLTAH